MKNKIQYYTFGIILLFFACYFTQVFNFPNEIVVVWGVLLCLILVIQQKKMRIDFGLCLLTISMIGYFVIVNGIRGLFFSIVYTAMMIHVLTTYAINVTDKEDRTMKILLMTLVLGFTIHGILNSYMYYAGYVVPGTRRWADFWSRGIIPGTQHAIYFLPAMAMFVPAILYFRKSRCFSVLMILLTIFFGYTSLATRSRMTILIFAILLFVQLLVYVILEKEKVKSIFADKKIWWCMTALLVLLAGSFCLIKDTEIMTAFINNMSKDGGILNNVRFVAQRQALQQLFDFPMGGRQMEMVLGNYCHNTWLDMANAAGLIPFFAFTGYTVYTLYNLIVFVRKESIATELKIFAVGVYAAFFLFFSVEPALDASIHYLTPWVFLNAIVHEKLARK